MEQENKKIGRKVFFAWTVGLSSLLMVPAFLRFRDKSKNTKTVKMLTQDGKLVEIDAVHIPAKKRKVKITDIHNWISKKPSL